MHRSYIHSPRLGTSRMHRSYIHAERSRPYWTPTATCARAHDRARMVPRKAARTALHGTHVHCGRAHFFAKRDSFGNLPMRIASGVTSTNSPATTYSTASSSVSCIAGVVVDFSSAPEERMLVSCFALQMLTLRSPVFACTP